MMKGIQGAKKANVAKPTKARTAKNVVPSKVTPEQITLDPSKKYEWEDTQTFVMSGIEFDVAMHSLAQFVNNPETKRTMALVNLYNIMDRKFKEAIIDGKIKVKDKFIKHILTEQDLIENPDLVSQGLTAGMEIQMQA